LTTRPPVRVVGVALICGLLLSGTSALPAQADAARTVRLEAAFSPERLGAGTTIRVGFQIATPAGEAPSPVTDVELLLPAGLAIATSDLGLETCSSASLEHEGLAGCPPDSLMGRGSALAEVPFGSEFVSEPAQVTLFSGPLQSGHLQLLFLASGELPVLANLVFGALVLPAQAPFGGLIDTTLPLIPSIRGGPDMALVGLQTTIGAKGITYYEHVKGRTISFKPRSLLLPKSCPSGGFHFGARMSFQDATHASASATVACPRGN
jgi:hypothetical protein